MYVWICNFKKAKCDSRGGTPRRCHVILKVKSETKRGITPTPQNHRRESLIAFHSLAHIVSDSAGLSLSQSSGLGWSQMSDVGHALVSSDRVQDSQSQSGSPLPCPFLLAGSMICVSILFEFFPCGDCSFLTCIDRSCSWPKAKPMPDTFFFSWIHHPCLPPWMSPRLVYLVLSTRTTFTSSSQSGKTSCSSLVLLITPQSTNQHPTTWLKGFTGNSRLRSWRSIFLRPGLTTFLWYSLPSDTRCSGRLLNFMRPDWSTYGWLSRPLSLTNGFLKFDDVAIRSTVIMH